jgi:hypothetical protein
MLIAIVLNNVLMSVIILNVVILSVVYDECLGNLWYTTKCIFWCNAILSTRLFVNAPFHQPLRPNLTCGLYYKHVTIVNDASSGVNK